MSPTEPRRGDALERLRDQRQQIDELFDSLDSHRIDPDTSTGETARIASLIFTLLRVHAQLESELLHPALVREAGSNAVLSEAAVRPAQALEAIEKVEGLDAQDPLHGAGMTGLRTCARRWFDADEKLFDLAQRTLIDVAMLDRQMAARQESLLTAGRES